MKLYLTTAVETQTPYILNTLANFLLTPVRYLYNGKTYAILNNTAQEIPLQKSDCPWIKTALMITLFIPCLISGAAARLLSFTSKDVTNGFTLINEPKKTIPIPLPTPAQPDSSSPFSSPTSSLTEPNDNSSSPTSVLTDDSSEYETKSSVHISPVIQQGYDYITPTKTIADLWDGPSKRDSDDGSGK